MYSFSSSTDSLITSSLFAPAASSKDSARPRRCLSSTKRYRGSGPSLERLLSAFMTSVLILFTLSRDTSDMFTPSISFLYGFENILPSPFEFFSFEWAYGFGQFLGACRPWREEVPTISSPDVPLCAVTCVVRVLVLIESHRGFAILADDCLTFVWCWPRAN